MSDLIDSLHDGTLRFPLLVSGDPEPAGELDVVSPWDGSKLATVATGNVNHANAAMDTAWRLYRNRDAWLPIHERVAILERLAELMSAEVDELTILAASEGGKPLVDSRVEVIRAIDGVRLCIEALRGDEIAGAALDVYEDEPALRPGLSELSNVVLLPHVGSATFDTRNEMARLAAINAVHLVRRERAPNTVNPEVYETAAYAERVREV